MAPERRSPKRDGPRCQVSSPDQTKGGANINVTIELYGVPRLRAGTGQLSLDASTLSEALDGLAHACPALDGAVVSQGRVLPAYRVSLNSDRFVTDPDTALAAGDVLIVLSADVGG